jgi:hypothetical protein
MAAENVDYEKREFDVLIEEYKRINNEISKRIDFLDKNISYQFILLGIIVTAISTIAKEGINENNLPIIQGILLITPILFYLLSFYYAINNMFILELGKYITKKISPRIKELTQKPGLLFDDYFQKNVLIKSNKFITTIVLQWPLVIPILLLAASVILDVHFSGLIQKNNIKVEILLIIVNLIFLTVTFFVNKKQFINILAK